MKRILGIFSLLFIFILGGCVVDDSATTPNNFNNTKEQLVENDTRKK